LLSKTPSNTVEWFLGPWKSVHWKTCSPEGRKWNFAPKKLNSVALVRERTIRTERPPPVGEVSANFCG
jgi:hypothetical protein